VVERVAPPVVAGNREFNSTLRVTNLTDNTLADGTGSDVDGPLGQILALPEPSAQTIVDTGGIDWIDTSGDASDALIDLRPGAHSSILGAAGNLTVAPGSDIENARTGARRAAPAEPPYPGQRWPPHETSDQVARPRERRDADGERLLLEHELEHEVQRPRQQQETQLPARPRPTHDPAHPETLLVRFRIFLLPDARRRAAWGTVRCGRSRVGGGGTRPLRLVEPAGELGESPRRAGNQRRKPGAAISTGFFCDAAFTRPAPSTFSSSANSAPSSRTDHSGPAR